MIIGCAETASAHPQEHCENGRLQQEPGDELTRRSHRHGSLSPHGRPPQHVQSGSLQLAHSGGTSLSRRMRIATGRWAPYCTRSPTSLTAAGADRRRELGRVASSEPAKVAASRNGKSRCRTRPIAEVHDGMDLRCELSARPGQPLLYDLPAGQVSCSGPAAPPAWPGTLGTPAAAAPHG
jgi:hypothetical protein